MESTTPDARRAPRNRPVIRAALEKCLEALDIDEPDYDTAAYYARIAVILMSGGHTHNLIYRRLGRDRMLAFELRSGDRILLQGPGKNSNQEAEILKIAKALESGRIVMTVSTPTNSERNVTFSLNDTVRIPVSEKES